MLHSSLALLQELADFNARDMYFDKDTLRCFRIIVRDCKARLTASGKALDQSEYFLVIYTLRLVNALINAMHVPVSTAYRDSSHNLNQLYLSPISLEWSSNPSLDSTQKPTLASYYPRFIEQKTRLFKTKEHINHDDFLFI